MEAERRELKEKGSDMDISKRKCYGYGDGGDGDGDDGVCPNCGCRHRDEIGRFDDGSTIRVTRMCRYCGRQFITTYQK